jgi:putative transposase
MLGSDWSNRYSFSIAEFYTNLRHHKIYFFPFPVFAWRLFSFPKTMLHYRKTSHTTYDCKYHIVWITKYRKPVLVGDIAVHVREMLRAICKDNDVEILKGHISKDHIHLMVSVPPHLSISKLVQYMKGKSSRKILSRFDDLRKIYWGRHFWARGYFVSTTGNVSDETVMEYIRNQDIADTDENFRISQEKL